MFTGKTSITVTVTPSASMCRLEAEEEKHLELLEKEELDAVREIVFEVFGIYVYGRLMYAPRIDLLSL
ncbi:hypothetical protein RvY_18685 [Ramazzottius varieornatus]|uniref:Uncharacterized protein n=1 Tax=Ramazzottius varieornatus TaxID=947166 RepID=A0A1D1W6P2_RAMVA|nr:hypothetical protein RvY_18685 [Ramazzottius varieornatus]